MDVIKRNVENKIIVYNIIRMEEEEEEEETFWYHCGRLVKAIRLYHEDEKICEKKISEICIFLHKHCMVGGGKYSNKGRIVGDYLAVDPLYITSYMATLNVFYKKHKHVINIATLVYYNFITIHPFSDGNGRVGKTLLFILSGVIGVTTKKQHKKLCKELRRLQKTPNMFNCSLNVNNLKSILIG